MDISESQYFFPISITIVLIPLRWLKVAILKLPLPLPLLQTAIMEIRAILKAQTDAAAASSNLLINRLEEVAGFRGSGSWIPEAAACTLLIRYIRENFKITTFSRLSGTNFFYESQT